MLYPFFECTVWVGHTFQLMAGLRSMDGNGTDKTDPMRQQ